MAIDKIFNDANVDGIADNIFGAVNNSVSEVKQMQQRKAAENVQMVVEAFKKIETNITEKFDNVTDVIEKRVLTIKDGRDGSSGSDGRNGRDGKPGRDGVNGKQGPPGTPGKDGENGLDGVSVTNANIDFDGSLVISLSSGQQINVGEVVPPELERQLVELRQGGGSAGSSGDVMGPTASTDNAIVRFDGTTGKVVQNSVVTIDDTGNTNFAQTPVLYSGDGTVESGRLLGRYSYRTATPTTAYFYDFNNSNTITSADSLAANKLATLIDSTVTNDNALTAFGTSYGTKAAGVSFVSGTASDILLASVGSAPLLNADINAVVVGYTSVGPRIAIQNYALNDDTANAISYVGAVHRFYPAGTEVAKISSTGLAVTGAATVSTTLGVTGVSTLTGGAVIQGLTVGLGAGAVATNTAVGASALVANTSGANNTAIGSGALDATTTAGNSTAVGSAAGTLATGIGNQFFGYNSGSAVTTGAKNVILGSYTGSAAPISATGSNNIVLSDGDGVVRQTIDSSGNVGIGTTAPDTKLTVSQGDIKVTGVSRNQMVVLERTDAANDYQWQLSGGSSLDLPFFAIVDNKGAANLERLRIDSSGNVLVTSVAGLGYGTGSGGAVTQATSRTTGVTLNNANGAITLVSAAGLATFQSFTVTNSKVAATDVVHVTQKSGTDLYQIFVTATAAGSFRISYATTGGITTEQPVFNFAVIKAVTA